MEIYHQIVRHDAVIYQNLNGFAFKGGNIFYGFAWSTLEAEKLKVTLES